MFLSTTVNKIDRKGRVSVPAAFRAALATQPYQGIVLFRSYTLAALEGSGVDRMERLSASVEEFDLFSERHDDLAATIFADALQLPFDGDGRVILPKSLAEHAGITDAAAFVGRGATFQIWEPDAFLRHQAEARTRVQRDGATLRLRPGAESGGDGA